MTEVHVVAVITTKPGKRSEVLSIFHENIPNVLAEPGCIEYSPTIDTQNAGDFQTEYGEDTFVVVEKWQSLDHLKAHIKTPHMANYASQVKDMLADRVIHILSPV